MLYELIFQKISNTIKLTSIMTRNKIKKKKNLNLVICIMRPFTIIKKIKS